MMLKMYELYSSSLQIDELGPLFFLYFILYIADTWLFYQPELLFAIKADHIFHIFLVQSDLSSVWKTHIYDHGSGPDFFEKVAAPEGS